MHSHLHSSIQDGCRGGAGGGGRLPISTALVVEEKALERMLVQPTHLKAKVNTEHDCTGFVHACVGWGK